MSASARLIIAHLLILSSLPKPCHGLQSVWGRSGRIRPFFGSISDPDTADIIVSPDSPSDEAQSPLTTGIGSSTDKLHGEREKWDAVEAPISMLSSIPAIPPSNVNVTNLRSESQATDLSRRQWLQFGAIAVGSVLATRLVDFESFVEKPANVTSKTGPSKLQSAHTKSTTSKSPAVVAPKKKLNRVNVTALVRETKVDLTMECTNTCVSLDRFTFEKKATLKLPGWVPSFLIPPPRTIRKLTDSEILIAALIAGSTVEMARTTLLYPIVTLKSRIQADIKKRVRTRMKRGNEKRLHPRRRAKILKFNAIRHFREGKLYAGLLPSLLVSVPATGVYYGIRDVARRSLNSFPALGDIQIAVSAALVASVVSVAIRTPADALAVRLQVATGKEQHIRNETEEEAEEAVRARVGNWFVESLERMPAVIITELPYLLSRIALNRYLIHGNVDLAHYELTTIATALLCGFITTPFDVARTRILIDSDDDPTNGIDGGSGMGLLTTMRTIMKEGNGGVSNLFAGWLERTIYLAIGRAWLEPLQILGYMALRDAILLEWFD